MAPVFFVAETTNEQRVYERLARAGVSLGLLSPVTFPQARKAGLYLMTAEGAATRRLDEVPGTGSHLCLIPPWPTPGLTLGTLPLSTTPAEHRDPIRLAPQLTMLLPPPANQERLLNILYREQFVGVAGTTLGASIAGEAVLLALPRTSNLLGLHLITTLLLGQPSIQTDLDDTVALLQALAAWVAAQAGAVAAPQRPSEAAGVPSRETEQQAHLALLALALLLPERTGNDVPATGVPIAQERVRHIVAHLAQLLGITASAAGFVQGWEALTTLGILSSSPLPDQTEAISLANVPRAYEYLNAWQLGPRLRRLRAMESATLQQAQGIPPPENRPADQAPAREG